MVLERGGQSQMIEDADLPAIIGNIGGEPTDVDAPDKAPLVLCPAFLEIWRPGDAMRFQTVKIIGKQIALMVASVANRKRGRNDVVHIVHVMAAYDELPIEQARTPRSAERRGGKEWFSKCRSRGSPSH